ncbi:interleukin-7 isoform X2 [Equus caballus]|uniref:interleukin-7 isoform X2 n=1 Tax=Equus caballus TaxID=9796 RepID=UPI000C9E0326|nr:interleukin-7 isoform X2 [Equus caballus]
MFHVSFRYIFGIPPLILVLLPVASSDCDIEGKDGKEYQNVLMISIDELGEFIRTERNLDSSPGLNTRFTDSMIEIDSNCLNNESNFFKKHSCDDNKEPLFLNRAARKMRQFLKMNISEDFNLHLARVSQGTLKLLNCTTKEENKSLKEQKKQNDLCFLKILLQKIKTCWNKILRDAKEH